MASGARRERSSNRFGVRAPCFKWTHHVVAHTHSGAIARPLRTVNAKRHIQGTPASARLRPHDAAIAATATSGGNTAVTRSRRVLQQCFKRTLLQRPAIADEMGLWHSVLAARPQCVSTGGVVVYSCADFESRIVAKPAHACSATAAAYLVRTAHTRLGRRLGRCSFAAVSVEGAAVVGARLSKSRSTCASTHFGQACCPDAQFHTVAWTAARPRLRDTAIVRLWRLQLLFRSRPE